MPQQREKNATSVVKGELVDKYIKEMASSDSSLDISEPISNISTNILPVSIFKKKS